MTKGWMKLQIFITILILVLTIVGWLSISYFQSKTEEYEKKKNE